MTIRVLAVASEIFPLVKTGGLGDVVGALPAALKQHGIETRTLVPGYPAVMSAIAERSIVAEIDDLFGGPAAIVAGKAKALELYAIDAPHLYDRPGNPYLGPAGADWPDNALRFAALGYIAAEIGSGRITDFNPGIVHAHDWHAGLAPVYLRYGAGPRPKTIITIHNIAFQGQFPASIFPVGRSGAGRCDLRGWWRDQPAGLMRSASPRQGAGHEQYSRQIVPKCKSPGWAQVRGMAR